MDLIRHLGWAQRRDVLPREGINVQKSNIVSDRIDKMTTCESKVANLEVEKAKKGELSRKASAAPAQRLKDHMLKNRILGQ